MKKTVITLCAIIIAFNTLCAQSGNWTDEGNYDISWYNNSEQSFTLSTPQELAGISVLSKNGKSLQYKTIYLSADIDLSAHYWVPIAFFSGDLEGNNHTISSMCISGTYAAAGFIGTSSSHFIQNLKFEKGKLRIVYDYTMEYKCGIGGIIGNHSLGSSNNLILKNCHFNGTIQIESSKSPLYAGGIMGSIHGNQKQPEVVDCSNEASLFIRHSYTDPNSSVNNYTYIGGIVGLCGSSIQDGIRLPGCKITRCRNNAPIEVNRKHSTLGYSQTYVGGITGYTCSDLTDCLNQYEIVVKDTLTRGSLLIGGITGSDEDLTTTVISKCINKASISCNQQSSEASSASVQIGGIIGNKTGSESLVTNCKNEGNITAITNGGVNAGGIAGEHFSGTLHACANHGRLVINSIQNQSTHTQAVSGGIIGNAGGGMVINSFNTGQIFSATKNSYNGYSDAYAGGIAGTLYNGNTPTTNPTIANCYNSGSIRANGVNYYPTSYAGGIVGWTYSSALTNNYNTGTVTAVSNNSAGKYYSAGGIVGYKSEDLNHVLSDIRSNYYISSRVTPWKNTLGTDKTEADMQTPGFAVLLTDWTKQYTGTPEAFAWEIRGEENGYFPAHINPLTPPLAIELPHSGNTQPLQIIVSEREIQITSPVTRKTLICSLQGSYVRPIQLTAGITLTIEDLSPGIYLIGSQKIIKVH